MNTMLATALTTFRAFVIKEFRHILRDKRTLLILIGMPIAQVLLFGFAITTEIKDGKLAILDHSQSSLSQRYITTLTSSGYFLFHQRLHHANHIEEAFKGGAVKIALVIPATFASDLTHKGYSTVQVIADATDPNTANMLVSYVAGSSALFAQENGFMRGEKALEISTKMLYNRENISVYLFVPGVITVILMLVSAMMTSIAVAREKELGTMEILLVSPLKVSTIIIGKVVPYVAIAIVNAAVILTIGLTVFTMPMTGSWMLLIAEILLFIVTSLTLGILISTVANSQQTAMLISLMGLMLPTILLSGFIFPISSMPLPLQLISNLVPAKWFIIIIKSIMLKGATLGTLWPQTVALLFFALIFTLLSIKRFKIRLE